VSKAGGRFLIHFGSAAIRYFAQLATRHNTPRERISAAAGFFIDGSFSERVVSSSC
jgi:hypothetical protein